MAFFLSAAHNAIDFMMITGSDRHLILPIENIIDRAINLGAPKILLLHTHPSGNPSPSDQDIVVTRKICTQLRRQGMRLYDHLIFTRHGMFSFRAHGML